VHRQESEAMTGFEHNGMAPIGLKDGVSIPIIVSDKIAALDPPMVFLGGGDVDLKMAVDIHEFVKATNAIVGNVTH
jgi:prolyl-tRNA editing enzyme YbaK/EbsC (Cys-tRNA(Pro) deacylase)